MFRRQLIRNNMTPLKTIQNGREEFEEAMSYVNADKALYPRVYLRDHIKSQTLALLNALLEEAKRRLETMKETHLCRFNDGECTCECYVASTQDQITSLEKLIKDVT